MVREEANMQIWLLFNGIVLELLTAEGSAQFTVKLEL